MKHRGVIARRKPFHVAIATKSLHIHKDDFINYNNLCRRVVARAGGSDALSGRFDPPRGTAAKPKPTMSIFTGKPKPKIP